MPENVDAELEGLEVEVDPKSPGEPTTYTGVPVRRHVAACHKLPVVGDTFWGHYPQLAPHVAKFELGTILAVRRVG
jgi:hypothetical protein